MTFVFSFNNVGMNTDIEWTFLVLNAKAIILSQSVYTLSFFSCVDINFIYLQAN